MREAHTQDFWKKINKYNYNSYVETIDLKGFNGLNAISITKGIQIVCGLNGAGKSTVLAGVKDLLGVCLDKQGLIKIEEAIVEGDIYLDGNKYHCKNSDGCRLNDQIDCLDRIGVLEYFHILKLLDVFLNQENLDELIEQNEVIEFEGDDIDEINYLIGRQYSKISLVEIEDMEDMGSIPFFIVEDGTTTYDSCKMGMGEYWLMYVYWYLKRANHDSIILIEEPESFVAIKSQKNLMNFIAKKSIESRLSFIISTHSPFVIEKVSNKNIKVISRAIGRTVIKAPKDGHANVVLGADENIKGTLLVEDNMAKYFLLVLLENEDTYIYRNYDIEIAGGASEISQVLKTEVLKNVNHKIIGVYDQDQQTVNLTANKLPYLFLPPEKDVETAMKKMILEGNIIQELCEALHKQEDEIIEVLAQISGEDHHDWLQNLAKYLHLEIRYLLQVLYSIWKKDNEELVSQFVIQLRETISL